MRTALVTGSAGFIGYFTARALLEVGWRVVGLDAMSDYYDVSLKGRRHAMLQKQRHFVPVIGRVETPGLLRGIFADYAPQLVIHLAAQAGVRHSMQHPGAYVQTNLVGTAELLEAARAYPPAHLLLASTSSIYGANTRMPYAERHKADHQMSFYAATKKATEAMGHSYAHLYGLPVTVFRFFTVYGPWGRPDMAPFKFTRAILEGTSIDVYNHGAQQRDFTYIDDLVAGILALAEAVPPAPPDATAHPVPDSLPASVSDAAAAPAATMTAVPDTITAAVPGDSLSPVAPFRTVNIGSGRPVPLMEFITAIEAVCGRPARKVFLPAQPGDVPATWADVTLFEALTGTRPATNLATGLARFVAWYRDYYDI